MPERVDQAHNDLDLRLVGPGGARHDSTSVPSVFERARVSAPIDLGTWALQIRGQALPAGPQVVYWAARAWRRDAAPDVIDCSE